MRKTIALMIIVALLLSSVPMALAQGRQEIRFLIQEIDPPSVAAYLEMEADFEAEYPDYDIVIEFTNPDSVMVKVTGVVAAGGVLDVFQPDPATAVRMAQNGQLLSIDSVVESMGGKEGFEPNVLLDVDGTSYCMPYASGGPVLWYRKDLLEAAGVEPPTTWDEWLAVAEATTGDGVFGAGIPGGENQFTTTLFQIMMWQSGSEIFDDDLSVHLADNPAALEALNFYTELLQYAPSGATSYSFGEVIDAFTSGRVATAVYWGRVLGRVYSDAPDLVGKVGAVPLPYNTMPATFADISYNCVYAETSNPEGALAWIEFMSRPEQAVKLQETVPGHLVPVTPEQAEALQNSDLPPLAENPEITDVLFGIQDYAYNVGLNAGSVDGENLTITPTGIVNPYLQILWSNNSPARAIQRVFLEGADPEQALQQAQEELDTAIEDAS